MACACASPMTAARDTIALGARLDATGWRVLVAYETTAERAIVDKVIAGGDVAAARAELVAQRARTHDGELALEALDVALEAAAQGVRDKRSDLASVLDKVGAAIEKVRAVLAQLGIGVSA